MVGQVTSVEEGPMEGVLVSARKAGSTLTTTVVTDQQGRYAFPRARLEPGEYALRIRAIGYEMARPVTVPIRGQQATTADLTLRKTHDLASQLTNAAADPSERVYAMGVLSAAGILAEMDDPTPLLPRRLSMLCEVERDDDGTDKECAEIR